MKSKTALSSMCRACAQRSLPISQPSTLLSRNSAQRSSQSSISLPLRQTTRSLSSTASSTAAAPYDSSAIPTEAAPPAAQPHQPRLTAAQLVSRAPSPSLPKPFLTATVTRIHASTAHATRTVPLLSKHLRKSFLTQTHDLVHDPYNLLRVGDVIRYSTFTPAEAAARATVKAEIAASSAARAAADKKTRRPLMGRRRPHDGKPSKRVRVRFVLRQVVSPFGEGLEERVAANSQKRKEMEIEMAEKDAAAAAEPKGKGKGKKKVVGSSSSGRSIVADLQVREGILEASTL